MLFLQGRAVSEPVEINLVEPAGERPLAFDPALFDFGKNRLDLDKLRDLGFNGFRVHFPVNKPPYKDEVLVFQGASYFRALGKGQSYGLSARGLAVDTAAAAGEEFPRFSEFWVERPRSNATSLVIHALLDSQARRRRLPLRPHPGQRDDDAGDGPAVSCARRSPSSAWRR